MVDWGSAGCRGRKRFVGTVLMLCALCGLHNTTVPVMVTGEPHFRVCIPTEGI